MAVEKKCFLRMGGLLIILFSESCAGLSPGLGLGRRRIFAGQKEINDETG
jgi:hypothetical protein